MADLQSIFSFYAGKDYEAGARLQVSGWLRLLRDSRLFTPTLDSAKAAVVFTQTLATQDKQPSMFFPGNKKRRQQLAEENHQMQLRRGAMDIHQFCDCLNAVADTRCAGVASTKNKEHMLEKVRCGHLPNHMRV